MNKIRVMAGAAALALAVSAGAGIGYAATSSSGPCQGKPGTIPYAYCALKVTYPRNAVVCGRNIPTASHCEIFGDGDRLGHDYGRSSYLVYGP